MKFLQRDSIHQFEYRINLTTQKFAFVSLFLETATCKSIGVADKNLVLDSRMAASSIYSSNWRPYYGRFDETRGEGRWCPQTKTNRNDYLQVDMESVRFVCSVATQGTYSPYYSTSYKLRFSIDGVNWKIYKTYNKAKVSHQKLNELDGVNASFMQPLVVFWLCNGFETLITWSNIPTTTEILA